MEQQYLDLLRKVKREGIRQKNRTGIDCLTIPGAMLQHDLADGFPLLTTKKMNFEAVVGELKGFLVGATSAKTFRELGCRIWDENANKNEAWLNNTNRKGEDDLGRIYGAQWREWQTDTHHVDQLAVALDLVRNNPDSRRIIVSAWNPAEMDKMALPPCHMMFQLIPHVSTGRLHMTMYQRSCDMFLGIPFNMASYALLLSLFSEWSGCAPGTLTMFLGDVHIYDNHMEQVDLQLAREPKPLPVIRTDMSSYIGPREDIKTMSMDEVVDLTILSEFYMLNYDPHPAIKAQMAV